MDDPSRLRRRNRGVAEKEPAVTTAALEAVAQRADSGLMIKTLDWGGRKWKGVRDIGDEVSLCDAIGCYGLLLLSLNSRQISMVGRESWWEGMTIDVALQDLQQFPRVYPVAVAAYVMAFAREATSNRERRKKG